MGFNADSVDREATSVVYGLWCDCQGDKRLRYVGRTRTTLRQRLRDHYGHRNIKDHPVKIWIREHATCNGLSGRVLESTSEDNLDNLEREWISLLRSAGFDLLNETAGGFGTRWADNVKTKLTPEEVLDIVDMLNSGLHPEKIAEQFPVTKETVYSIKTGRNWGWLTRGRLHMEHIAELRLEVEAEEAFRG